MRYNLIALTNPVPGREAEFEAAWDALQSKVWPSAVVRAARPPNQPPRVASRSTPAFTQVYRL